MRRDYVAQDVTIASGEALSGSIHLRAFSGGMVLIPSAWTAANLGFKISETPAGTYAHLEPHDSADPVQIENIPTSTSVWKEIPPEVFAAGFMKLWSKSATAATETDVNQGAERTITVVLKS